jgi:hypothetical protein
VLRGHPADGSHHLWYTPDVVEKASRHEQPVLRVVFYRTETGNEPVREWLKEMPREDRKAIGQDIKSAQYGWPLGMPLIRKMPPAELTTARRRLASLREE